MKVGIIQFLKGPEGKDSKLSDIAEENLCHKIIALGGDKDGRIMHYLAYLLIDRRVKPNYMKEAIDLLDKAIALGNVGATVNRAEIYCRGEGEEDNRPNHSQAIKLYQKAITFGSAEAFSFQGYFGALPHDYSFNIADEVY